MSTPERFYTPERFRQEQMHVAESPRGGLLMSSCGAGAYLARRVVKAYREQLAAAGAESGFPYLEGIDFQFSDSETCVRLPADVSGRDVFLFQTLLDPTATSQHADGRTHTGQVDHNYMAFLIAVRTLREWGANHVTAILPYLAYARQDKPTEYQREPTTAKLMADLAIKSGLDRLITWDPHSASIRGFYDNVPVETLEALPSKCWWKKKVFKKST